MSNNSDKKTSECNDKKEKNKEDVEGLVKQLTSLLFIFSESIAETLSHVGW